MLEDNQKMLDYCCIMLHDRAELGCGAISNNLLVELFIRNSLQVLSTTRVVHYFENHIVGKSAICEFESPVARKWARFHNSLKKRPGYELLHPFTKLEQSDIKDIRYVKYKILAYEIEHQINSIQTFDSFLKKKFIFNSPNLQEGQMNQPPQSRKFLAKRSPVPKIRDNLPQIKSQKTSGSDVESTEHYTKNAAYGFCDAHGINELMVQTTIHAHCSCVGKLRHFLRKSFFKPTLVIECTAHGPGCNIGRMKAINLTQSTTLELNSERLQCSVPAVNFAGAILLSGLNMTRFARSVRQSGLKVSNRKMKAVSDVFANASLKEYTEQQERTNVAYNSKPNTSVAIDTSFSQGRNAQYSQTAALEATSGEILQLVVLDKHQENCSSNSLEVLGVEKIIDLCFDAKVPLAVVSTDECSSTGSLLRKKSSKQLEKFGLKIIPQNDPFHKIKNAKKARKSEFQDRKLESQKIVAKLDHLKRAGLIDIAIQLGIKLENLNHNKRRLIDLLDPKLRSISKIFHLIVGRKVVRLSQLKNSGKIENSIVKRKEIREICRAQLKAHDVEEVCTQTEGAIDEAVDCCFYLDRDLVSSNLLKLLDNHKVVLAKLQAMQLKPKVFKNQVSDMSVVLKRKIVQHEKFRWKKVEDSSKAKEFHMDLKIYEEVFFHRCRRKKVILYDTKDERHIEIITMRSDKNLECIGLQGVAENLSEKIKASFKESKWIEIIDSRFSRGGAKKFPILNLPLFTKRNPDGETQGQTLLGKFSTHEFRSTDKSYEAVGELTGAQGLRSEIFGFFKHYRSIEARTKYKMLNSPDFEAEFSKFEQFIKRLWSLETCKRFSLSVRTNMVESFFATRLFYVPKNLKFPMNYLSKIHICGMSWNEEHISECYRKHYGASGISYRKNWWQNIHDSVFRTYPPHKYLENRGRVAGYTPAIINRKRLRMPQSSVKKRKLKL